MPTSAGINLNIGSETERELTAIFGAKGFTLNSAVAWWLSQVCAKSLPFEPEKYDFKPTPSFLAELDRMDKEGDWAGPFSTIEELNAWLDEEDEDEI